MILRAVATSFAVASLMAFLLQGRSDSITPTTRVGVITGTVVTTDSPAQPVPKAVVRLISPDAHDVLTSVTGEDGRFAFGGLSPDRYSISASKPGWITTAYGARAAGRPGVPIVISEATPQVDAVVRLFKGAAITGQIRDQRGASAPHQYVAALQRRTTESGRVFERAPASTASAGFYGSMTDDRGIYRLYGLAPGEYVVVVGWIPQRAIEPMYETTADDIQRALRLLQDPAYVPPAVQPQLIRPNVVGVSLLNLGRPAGTPLGIAPVYYPGTFVLSNATVVNLKPGEEAEGIDVSVAPARAAIVQGALQDREGRAIPRAAVQLIPDEPEMGSRGAAGSLALDAQGHFQASSVAPGRYLLEAQTVPSSASGPAVPLMWGTAPVEVLGENVSGLPLVLEPLGSISGVVISNTSRTVVNGLVEIVLTPERPLPGSWRRVVPVTVRDGRFTIPSVIPGRYRIATKTGAWTLVAASANERDAADTPFEVAPGAESRVAIEVTDRPAELSGLLQGPDGRPVQGAQTSIVVFPTDRANWYWQSRRIAAVSVATDGSFKFTGLPAGEYFVAGATDLEPGECFDSSVLDQLMPASVRVKLTLGTQTTQNVRAGRQSP